MGQAVCAIGRFDQARGGLICPPGSISTTRVLKDSADEVKKQIRGKLIPHGLGSSIVLMVVHGTILIASLL